MNKYIEKMAELNKQSANWPKIMNRLRKGKSSEEVRETIQSLSDKAFTKSNSSLEKVINEVPEKYFSTEKTISKKDNVHEAVFGKKKHLDDVSKNNRQYFDRAKKLLGASDRLLKEVDRPNMYLAN